MTKPAPAAELRKKYSWIETLRAHGIPIDEKLSELAHSPKIRAMVHPFFSL